MGENKLMLKIACIAVLGMGIIGAIGVLMLSKNDPSTGLLKLLSICFNGITYGLLGAVSYSVYNKHTTQQLSLVAVGICVIAFGISTYGTLTQASSMGYIKAVVIFFVMAIALAQVCMLYKIEIVNKYAAISRIIAVATITIFSLMVIILIMGNVENFASEIQYNGIFIIKMYMCMLILDLTFTALTPLLNKLTEGAYEQHNELDEFLSTADDTPPIINHNPGEHNS